MADLIQLAMNLAGCAVLLALYFLPAIIAARQEHHDRNLILVVNWCFGWTGAGWVIAFVWAVSPDAASNTAGARDPSRHRFSSTAPAVRSSSVPVPQPPSR